MMGFSGNVVDDGMEDPSTLEDGDLTVGDAVTGTVTLTVGRAVGALVPTLSAFTVGDNVAGNVTLNVGWAVGALDSSPGTGGEGLGGAGKTLILDFLKR